MICYERKNVRTLLRTSKNVNAWQLTLWLNKYSKDELNLYERKKNMKEKPQLQTSRTSVPQQCIWRLAWFWINNDVNMLKYTI